MQEGSPTLDFLRKLKAFPVYFYVYTVSLLGFILDDFLFTTLMLAGVTSGLALGSVAGGFAIFFTLFVVLRLVNHLGDAHVAAARVAQAPPVLGPDAEPIYDGGEIIA